MNTCSVVDLPFVFEFVPRTFYHIQVARTFFRTDKSETGRRFSLVSSFCSVACSGVSIPSLRIVAYSSDSVLILKFWRCFRILLSTGAFFSASATMLSGPALLLFLSFFAIFLDFAYCEKFVQFARWILFFFYIILLENALEVFRYLLYLIFL